MLIKQFPDKPKKAIETLSLIVQTFLDNELLSDKSLVDILLNKTPIEGNQSFIVKRIQVILDNMIDHGTTDLSTFEKLTKYLIDLSQRAFKSFDSSKTDEWLQPLILDSEKSFLALLLSKAALGNEEIQSHLKLLTDTYIDVALFLLIGLKKSEAKRTQLFNCLKEMPQFGDTESPQIELLFFESTGKNEAEINNEIGDDDYGKDDDEVKVDPL